MNIFIIGAGKVGFSLAEMLSQEAHDVFVIERDPERAEVVNEKLDVQVVVGNGASPQFQKDTGFSQGDLLVAVTDNDEVNMMACMFAKEIGVDKTVARVRNVEYAMDGAIKDDPRLAIDLFINPEQVAAGVIANHIQVPEAHSITYFDNKNVVMLELPVQPNNAIVGKALKDLKAEYPFLITAVVRHDKLFIPDGNTILEAGDSMYLFAKNANIHAVEKALGFKRARVNQVMILGGGRLGYYLAEKLEPTDIHVKIIEKSYARCEVLAGLLDSTIVLHGDVSDIDILQDEGVHEVDILVGSTEDDKLNVLVCLLGSRLGAKRTIAQIRRSDYLPLIESVGIDVAVSPRLLTSEAILRFVRKGNMTSVALVETGDAEVLEFLVDDSHRRLTGCTIAELGLPRGIIVSTIYRNSDVIIPRGHDSIHLGDRLTMFVAREQIKKVEKIINN